MPLVTLDDACLAYGDAALLDHAQLQIDEAERIGLIGRNGCGKSSLLRVLAGVASLDDGKLWRAGGLGIAYVPQEPAFDPDTAVFDLIAAGLGETARQLIAYHELGQALGAAPSAADLERMHALQAELEHGDGWRLNTRVEQMLSALQLPGEARAGTLSGGMIKRVALGQALVAEPGLLLLDEPTNHLDLDGIGWLEALLVDFRGTVVVVTHDRRFLDRVATRIVELDRGRLRSYPGNYAQYQARKGEELAAEQAARDKFDQLLAQEEVWIRQGVEARRTRNEGRVQRLERLRRERAARRERFGEVRLTVDRGQVSGRVVVELTEVSKSFPYGDGRRTVVREFSCTILRGDKVGLIGPNGVGKTTLLKLMLGELTPDAGSVRLGTKLQVAYFDQFRAQLDPDAMLCEVISPGAEYVEIGGKRQHVIGYLGDFLFAPQRARAPVRTLSGGERNRLLLARLFARPANVIVLDEPTNDLDIETLELLEALLADYDGTVLLVSHDRAFLDAVVTQTIAYEGDGRWREYAGGYDDWWRVKQAELERAAKAARPAAIIAKTAPPARVRAPAPGKLSFNEQRELDGLPDRIDALEAEQRALAQRLADSALYRQAPGEVPGLQARLRDVEQELEAALARWELLATRAQA